MSDDEVGSIKNLTDSFTSAAEGIASGYTGSSGRGEFTDLVSDKFARLNLKYPLDVEGPEQGHFVRFTIHSVSGAKLETQGRNAPEQNPEGGFLGGILSEIKSSDVGTNVGGFFSDALNSVGGAVNQLTGEIGSVTGSVSDTIDGLTSSVGLGNLGTAAVGGVIDQGMSTLGGVVNMPGSVGAITSGLSGLFGFKRRSLGHMVLYMPHQINESYRTNWSAQEIGFLGSMALQAARSGSGMSGWEILGQAAATGKEGAIAVGLQKLFGVVGQESLVNLALREGVGTGTKAAINPHMEQFFQGVEFRNFSFSFKFSPRSQKEAREVQSIIRAFKFYSAPAHYGVGEYGAFFQYPNEFGIEYWNSNRLHKIKKCALTSVDVNYAGSGTNSTFYDGHPVETDLNLTFVELTQMTKKDFQQADGNMGGY